MKKYKPMSKEQVAELPQYVQDNIASILKCYNECNVTYEYGGYKVSSAIAVLAHYAPDHKFIGCVYADDFYTEEERILNYVNEFRDYPSFYHGKRDYRILTYDRTVAYKMVNGNIEVA